MPSPHVESVKGHRDFRLLWAGSISSQFGSAIGMVALPFIAVMVLQVSEWQVSLLAGLSALATALLALPIGRKVEHLGKRPVMIGCDLIRAELFAGLTFVWAHPALRPMLGSWVLFAGASAMASPLLLPKREE